MARPSVWIEAPEAIFVEQAVVLQAHVLVEEPTPIEFIDFSVECEEGWSVGSGKSRKTESKVLVYAIERVHEGGDLAEGRHTFRLRVFLPPGVPPTHELEPAYARLVAKVHISLAWRIDVRQSAPLVARLSAPRDVVRESLVVQSEDDGEPDAPRIELGLPSRVLASGHMVTGSIAVSHFDDSEPRDVEIVLRPNFALHREASDIERDGATHTYQVTVPRGQAGRSIPFHLQIPNVPPSFRAPTHTLAWSLTAVTGSLFSRRAEVTAPVEIVDMAATFAEEADRPPDLAVERITALFAAQEGWQPGPGEALHLMKNVDRAMLSATYAYRGEAGTFLVARIRYLSLGLELRVAPSSRLAEMLSNDVEVGVKDWDRTHRVSARSKAQAEPFLGAVVPWLMKAGRLGHLQWWDDAAAVFERPLGTLDEEQLALYLQAIESLARIIVDARQRIEPPLSIDVPAWQALARALGAELVVGDLSIDGHYGAQPVAIRLEWDRATPLRLRVDVGDADARMTDTLPVAEGLEAGKVRALVERLVLGRQGPYR